MVEAHWLVAKKSRLVIRRVYVEVYNVVAKYW